MATEAAEAAVAGTGDPQFITYEVKDAVAWVMLNRPQYGNAQNYRLLNQLDAAFKQSRKAGVPLWSRAARLAAAS